jgi:hypothetical protein
VPLESLPEEAVIKKYDLITLFRKVSSFLMLICQVWALTFVPLDQIIPMWNSVIAKIISK